jgi:hypothetical protein
MAYAGDRFFKRSQLRRRGWTNSLIARFMPEPDGNLPTDHPVANCETFRIFLRSRVKAIESTPEFQRAVQDRISMRRALHRVARTPLEHLLAGITVPVVPWNVLVTRACNNYNRWCQRHERIRTEPVTPTPSTAMVTRIVVNYLRHNLTDYDEILKDNVRLLGIHVYPILKKAVIEQIASKYPRLAVECRSQHENMIITSQLVNSTTIPSSPAPKT